MLNDIKTITADSFGSNCPENWEEIADWMNAALEKKYHDASTLLKPAYELRDQLYEKWNERKTKAFWNHLQDVEKQIEEKEEEWNNFQDSFWEAYCRGEFADAPTAQE